jgi:cell wall assembly regulator SMI1
MPTTVLAELSRLESIIVDHGFPFRTVPGATEGELADVESTLNISLTDDFRELYRGSNGVAPKGGAWFAVCTDELTPCTFLSLKKGLEWWSEWLPYDEAVHAQFGYDDGPRDERIAPRVFVHRRWFPFAEFNCFGTTVFFDASPTDRGAVGQVIAYQHDPDAVHYLAPSIAEFLRESNSRLSRNIQQLYFVDGEPSLAAPR